MFLIFKVIKLFLTAFIFIDLIGVFNFGKVGFFGSLRCIILTKWGLVDRSSQKIIELSLYLMLHLYLLAIFLFLNEPLSLFFILPILYQLSFKQTVFLLELRVLFQDICQFKRGVIELFFIVFIAAELLVLHLLLENLDSLLVVLYFLIQA